MDIQRFLKRPMTSANTLQEVEPEPVILPTNADDLETPGTSSSKPS